MNYRWTIYLVNLDPTVGSEQAKTRPVIIISDESMNQILPVLNILPLTSYKSGRIVYENEVFLKKEDTKLDKDSIALCYQIRTIDKTRLIKKIGEVKSEKLRNEIEEALRFQLGF